MIYSADLTGGVRSSESRKDDPFDPSSFSFFGLATGVGTGVWVIKFSTDL